MPRREDCLLRPVQDTDRDLILQWRNSERVRANMFNDHIISHEEHLAWFQRITKEPIPLFLVFEYLRRPLGIVSITRIDRLNNRCLWGFYLGETDGPPESGMVMAYMGLAYIFEHLKIRKLCSEAFVFNQGSIRFHQKLGFTQEGIFVKHVLKNGFYQDIISFALFEEDWPNIKASLNRTCFEETDQR
jgi:UDP-4-amino-4,6-dideoxy-N-acetyl-beta-L-altrosamine N-acetyltransferase